MTTDTFLLETPGQQKSKQGISNFSLDMNTAALKNVTYEPGHAPTNRGMSRQGMVDMEVSQSEHIKCIYFLTLRILWLEKIRRLNLIPHCWTREQWKN